MREKRKVQAGPLENQRQPLQPTQEAGLPRNLLARNTQTQVGVTPEEGPQGDIRLQAGQRRPQAGVDAFTEGDVTPGTLAGNVKLLRV